MDEAISEEKLDYFNSDKNLLILHVLLEGFFRGQNVFTLEQFLKGDYWKIGEIREEILDTNDFGSVEDLVLHQVIHIIDDLEIGEIKRVSVNDIYGLTEKIAREAVMKKDASENDVAYFTAVLHSLCDLEKIRAEQIVKAMKESKEFDRKIFHRVDFAEEGFGKYLDDIAPIATSHIEIEVGFDDRNAANIKKIDQAIKDYIFGFSQDDYIDNKPTYMQKRFYFSKQMENFYNYIKELPVIDNSINIPFSSLNEGGFEMIKILTYLEREKRIKVRSWNDVDMWNVKFHKTPITLPSLLGQEDANDTKLTKDETEIKLNLSFANQTGVMVLRDQGGKEYKIRVQGQVQKEVLRVIFQNPESTYSEWSLYDISEILGGEDVNETGVKNAIYQFNRKVKLALPRVENLFELTKHSARLNEKYVERN